MSVFSSSTQAPQEERGDSAKAVAQPADAVTCTPNLTKFEKERAPVLSFIMA